MSSPIARSPWILLFGVSGQTKALFFRQLATMVNSGLPLGRAISTASGAGLTKVGQELAKLVDGGSRLSEAMTKYPYHFSRHETALVQAGESSGQLDRQLVELAKSAELDWQLSKKISGKLIYPILVAHSAILLPPLFLLVKDGIEAYVRAVLVLLLPLYIVFGGGWLMYRLFSQHGGPRRLMDHLLSSLPVVREPCRFGARIRFLQTMANLSEAGFIPGQAIPLAAQSCNNFWLQDRVLGSWSKLGKEVPVSEIMRHSQAFQMFELGLVRSGEESGSFSRSLKKAAESLRPEYEAQVHRLTVILPILLLFVLGGFVGFMAIKTMTGIFAPIADII